MRKAGGQAARFLHASTDYYHEPQVAVAEAIAEIVPIDGPVRTFFSNSGTEAVEAAIKLASGCAAECLSSPSSRLD